MRIKPHRLGIKRSGLFGDVEGNSVVDRDRVQVDVIRCCILGGFLRHGFLLGAGELGLELVGNGAGHFAFHSEDVVEFPIVTFRPEMFVVRSANQLHIHVHGISDFLHAALQQIRHAQLPADVAQIVRRAFVFLGRSARDDFERCDLRKPGQDFVLDAVGKIGVIGIAAEVLKRQNSDTFFGNRRSRAGAGSTRPDAVRNAVRLAKNSAAAPTTINAPIPRAIVE